MTLEQYLRAAAARLANAETPHLDARVLAKHSLGFDDTGLILNAKRELAADEEARLDALVAQRARGEAVAHIVGEKEFYGRLFKLAPGVLAPRPDSETLIEAVAARRRRNAPLKILDLGAGSGCLLLTVLTNFPNATGLGVDINENAARNAIANAAAHGLGARAAFVVGDWTEALAGRFDVIISNPPYIREGDHAALAPEIREFEDRRALVAGVDGLSAYEAILAVAPERLSPEGLIVLELGEGQDEALRRLADAAFPSARLTIEADLAGRPRAFVIDLAPQKSV